MNNGISKNMNRRFFLKLALFAMMIAVFVVSMVFAGCSCNKDPEPTPTPIESEVEITLEESSLSIMRYESKTLLYTISGSEEKPTIASNNTAVAIVDSNGVITGVTEGVADITVSLGGKTATCVVTITKSTVAPTISFESEIKLETGTSFEGEVKALWNGKTVIDSIEWSCAFAENQAEDKARVSVTEKGIVKIEGIAQGTTQFYISATVREKYVNKLVMVTVVEPVPVLYPTSSNVTAKDDGYSVLLSMQDTATLSTSKNLVFGVTEGSTVTDNVAVVWQEITSTSVATVVESGGVYTFTKNIAGNGKWKGTYTSATGKTAEIILYVTISKVEQTISYNPTLVVEDLVALNVSGIITGDVTVATLDGIDVFSSFSGTNLTLKKSAMPTQAKNMGVGREFVLETADCIYHATADVYTKIIKTKSDLNSFASIARTNGNFNSVGLLDGYFLLGANIDYNAVFTSPTDTGEIYNKNNELKASTGDNSLSWQTTSRYGFKGVFDGCGYNIDGLTVKAKTSNSESGGFIGYLNDEGIVKNISFTNAGVYENCGLICAYGGGTVENISITFSSIGVGNAIANNGVTGAFFTRIISGFGTSATIKNCVVDAIGATINMPNQSASALRLGTAREKGIDNLIVLCDNATVLGNSGGTSKYSTYGELISSTDILALDSEYWTTIVGGVPFLKNAIDTIDTSKTITASIDKSSIYAGENTSLNINERYYTIVADIPDGVEVTRNAIKTTANCKDANVTITVKSLLNDSTATFTLSIIAVEHITGDGERADVNVIYDASNNGTFSVDLSEFANNLGDTIDSVTISGTQVGSGVAVTGNAITLNIDDITQNSVEGITLSMMTTKNNTTYSFDVNIKLIHQIGTAAVFEKIFSSNATLYATYKLINNITITTDYTAPGVTLYGTFDGDGYSLSGIRVRSNGGSLGAWSNRCFVASLEKSGTIKNIAFLEVELSEQAQFVRTVLGTIENVYVGYKTFNFGSQVQKATFGNPFATNTGTLRNVVVDFRSATVGGVTKTTASGTSSMIGKFESNATLENVVALGVANEYKDYVITGNKSNGDIYVAYTDSTDNGKTFPTGFDSAYWTVDPVNKTIVWKSKS